jgi:hypothetical protein
VYRRVPVCEYNSIDRGHVVFLKFLFDSRSVRVDWVFLFFCGKVYALMINYSYNTLIN